MTKLTVAAFGIIFDKDKINSDIIAIYLLIIIFANQLNRNINEKPQNCTFSPCGRGGGKL
jgi:hypothetical protein